MIIRTYNAVFECRAQLQDAPARFLILLTLTCQRVHTSGSYKEKSLQAITATIDDGDSKMPTAPRERTADAHHNMAKELEPSTCKTMGHGYAGMGVVREAEEESGEEMVVGSKKRTLLKRNQTASSCSCGGVSMDLEQSSGNRGCLPTSTLPSHAKSTTTINAIASIPKTPLLFLSECVFLKYH